MTVRVSTGVRNGQAAGLGLAALFNRGVLNIYSGAQPASADAAATGTLLGTVTAASAAYTNETQATATLQVTGSSGTLTFVKVGTLPIIDQASEVVWTTDVNTTAALICAALNRSGIVTATVSTDTITMKPPVGFGDAWNTLAVTSGGIACTGSSFSGGVDSANGLLFGEAAAGVLQKSATQVWSFNGLAAGTAGWFRFVGAVADGGSLISGVPYLPRIDGSIANSGADLNLSNTSITIDAPNTIDRFRITMRSE